MPTRPTTCALPCALQREFDLDITLEHVTEGHMIVDELAKENVPWLWAPPSDMPASLSFRTRPGETPGVLAKAGCHVSIITDAPVIRSTTCPYAQALP